MEESSQILLVEDEPAHAELAQRALSAAPYRLAVAETLGAARAWLATRAPDVVVCDLRLPDGSALELLSDGLPLVVMTSQGDEQRAVAAMKAGALDYVVKSPEMYRDLPLTIGRALRASRADRERRRTEASLRESEERFRQLADNIAEAFWLYDLREGKLVYTSPAWPRVYGQPAGLAAVDPNARFASIHPDEREQVRAAFEQDAPLRPLDHVYRIMRDGGVRFIEERTFPIAADGQPWRIAGLGMDVTKRKELEAALSQSQKMEAIGQLAGGVAHDFNNMLTAIMTSAEQLRMHAAEPAQRELCDIMLTAAERAAELTRKLLSFSRKGKLRSAALDVHAVVRETAGLLERSIDRRVRITSALSAEQSVVVGDANQIQNALLNLGINARDAMPDGGELRFSTAVRHFDEASCATIPFELLPGPYLEVSVHDNGHGIPQEYLPRVFEPFFTTKPAGHGTGLGLAAVYGAAVEHGGAVTVYSDPGRGSVFHLYLPLSQRVPVLAPRPADVPRGTGLVLLIDDEPLVRSAGVQLLRSLGYEVIAAKNGLEGVELFRQRHAELAVVLCDLMMPELSGSDAAQRMRELDPNVPIVICSGFPRDERFTGHGEPADAFLAKPFHRADLALVLARASRRLPPRKDH